MKVSNAFAPTARNCFWGPQRGNVTKTPLEGQSGTFPLRGAPQTVSRSWSEPVLRVQLRWSETLKLLTSSPSRDSNSTRRGLPNTPANTPQQRPEQQRTVHISLNLTGVCIREQPLLPSRSLPGSAPPPWLRELRSMRRSGGLSHLRGAVPLLGLSTSKVRPPRS